MAVGPLAVEIADSRADGNSIGFELAGGARGSVVRSAAARNDAYGFVFATGAVVAASDLVADGNALAGVGVFDAGTRATLSGVTLSNSGANGLELAFGTPLARISGSTVTGNVTGLRRTNGTLETFGDNLVRGNTTETVGTITAVGKT